MKYLPQFQTLMHQTDAKILTARTTIQDIERRIRELSNQKQQIQNDLQNEEIHREHLHEAFVINHGVPENVALLRESIIANKAEMKRKSITVGRLEKLKETTEQRIEELKKLCKHEFVIGYRSYEGSYSRDYDDAHSGKRLCIVCTYEERSTGTKQSAGFGFSSEKEDIYTVLKETASRLVASDHDEMGKTDYWQSSQTLLEKFFITANIARILDSLT